MYYQCDWHGLHIDRRGVIHFKQPQLVLNTVINQSVHCLPGVLGPQPSEFMSHGKEGVRNCFSADGLATQGNSTVSVSCGKDLQVGDEIREIPKEGINVVTSAEGTPEHPMGSHFCDVGCSNYIGHRFFDNVKIKLEFIGLRRWYFCQGTGCEKWGLK